MYAHRGSPPRAWGQRALQHVSGRSPRFTPTGVGTTESLTYSFPSPSVHPHGRGDNAASVSQPGALTGSPPRAWGQQFPLRKKIAGERFTPTGVGTTSRRSLPKCLKAVHPHGRGDNYDTQLDRATKLGSPPRAWGQHNRSDSRAATHRFTPTGVGTTQLFAPRLGSLAGHPHGRGDNQSWLVLPAERNGSPPRAWGQREPRALYPP